MIDLKDLELANAISMNDAGDLEAALLEAMDAMALHGSATETMQVIAALLVVAKREKASAFKAHEMLSAPQAA